MAVRSFTTRASFTSRERDLSGVEGLEEAIRKLRSLPVAITGRNGGQVRSALMYASLPIFKAIKANLMGHRANISAMAKDVRRVREKRPDLQGLSEAINIGLRQQKTLPMWWWYEWGTVPRHTRKGGGRGEIMAQPFFRPGFDLGRPLLAPRFGLKLKQLAEREVKKLARGGVPR